MACPDKNKKVYKRLATQLSRDNIFRVWDLITSDDFNAWYGTRRRDSEGMPEINKYLEIYGEDLSVDSLLRNTIELETADDVKMLFRSNSTLGIKKYNGGYYITKENRQHGVKLVNFLNVRYPGLLDLNTKWKQTSEIGVVDRSQPVIKLDINESALKDRVFFSPKVQEIEEVEDKSEKGLTYIINRLLEYSERLHNKITNAKAKGENSVVEKVSLQRDKVLESLDSLQKDRELQSIAKVATSNLKYVASIFNKEGEITADELIEAEDILSLYENLDKRNHPMGVLSKEDLDKVLVVEIDNDTGKETELLDFVESTKQIQSVVNEASKLRATFDEIAKKLIVDTYNTNHDTNITIEDLFENLKDINPAERGLRDAGSVNNRLLNMLQGLHAFASRQAEQRTVNDLTELETKTKALDNKKAVFEAMWQKDKDGNNTGGLVDEYSHEYAKMKSEQVAILYDRSSTKTQIKTAKDKLYDTHDYVNYFDDIYSNNIKEIDSGEYELLSEEEKENFSLLKTLSEGQENETARLTSLYGKNKADELIKEANKTFDNFRDRRKYRFEDIDVQEDSAVNKRTAKELWEMENSPTATINSMGATEVPTDPQGIPIRSNFDFIVSMPRTHTRTSKKPTEFYDSNYAKLKENTNSFDYYTYTKDKINQLLGYYPQTYLDQKNVKDGFIPTLKKQEFQKLIQDGKLSIIKGTGEMVRGGVFGKTYSATTSHIKGTTGQAINTLDIAMLAPKFNRVENGKEVKSDDIVTDFEDIMGAFIPLSNTYLHKSKIEGIFNITVDVIGTLQGVDKVQKGTNDKVANTLPQINKMAQFQKEVFYGVQRKNREKYTDLKYMTKEDKVNKEELIIKLEDAKELLKDEFNLLTEEENDKYTKQVENIEKKLTELGVNFSATKATKKVLGFYQYLTLAWSLTSPAIEFLYGGISNHTHATSEVDYTVKQNRAARAIAIAATMPGSSNSKTSKKFLALVEKYGAVGDVNHIEKKNANASKQVNYIKNLFSSFGLARNADIISKGGVMAATLMNTEIIDENGNVSNLWEAYNEEGNLKDKFATEENLAKWEVDVESVNSNDQLRLANKIAGINMKNHGNYDKYSDIEISASALGLAVTQHRRWMIEGFASRFEGVRYNTRLGRDVKGRYVTYMDLTKQLGKKATISIMFRALANRMTLGSISAESAQNLASKYGKDGTDTEISLTDLENIRKNAAGLMWTVMIWLALAIAQASVDEDDKDKFSSWNFLINQGGRLQQDLIMWTSPNTASDVTGQFIPAMRLTEKLSGWVDAVYTKVTENDPKKLVYQSGALKGESKLIDKSLQLTPGINKINSIKRITYEVFK